MKRLVEFIKQHPLLVYFVLAYGLTWIVFPLVLISQALGVLGFFGPALAAILVTGITDGRQGVMALLGRLKERRVNPAWYGVTLILPVVLSAVVALLGLWLGYPGSIQWSELSPLILVVFVFVVGEEIGWRGYALPKLLADRAALPASLVLGVAWGLWHLPTFFVPGLPQANIPVIAYLIYVISLSILFTWVFQNTHGSLLVATLFHGAINTFGFVNPSLEPAARWWLIAGVYATAAVVVIGATGVSLSRRAKVQVEAARMG